MTITQIRKKEDTVLYLNRAVYFCPILEINKARGKKYQ